MAEFGGKDGGDGGRKGAGVVAFGFMFGDVGVVGVCGLKG